MGGTSSLDLMMRPFESGTLILVLQLEIPWRGILADVNSVACSPDGQYIISGSDDGSIRIWDADTGATVGKPLKAHERPVWSVAYSPDGRHIISGSRYRRFESGMLIQVLQWANLWRGIPGLCFPLLTLLMGGTSSLDPLTCLFGSGIPRPVL
jgi:WD40 repeat protein